MVEYRPVADDEAEAFRDVLDYAFRPEAGPMPDRDVDDEPTPIGDRRGLFEGDELLTTAVHLPFRVSIRGRWHETAGLSGVATRPEHRRRGLVRRLLGDSLAETRDDARPFSLLWPFKHAFYGRFGWGRLGTYGRYELEPAALAPVADHPLAGGRIEPLTVDDIPALRALDDAFAARYDRTIRRTEAWYRHRFFEGWTTDPYVYGWYREGDLRGYLRYQVTDDGDDRRLDVWELGAPDDESAVNLLGYLHGHEDHVARIRAFAPVDELWFDLVDDAGSVEVEVGPGPMGRLVDVAAGLEALPAPDGVEGAVTLAVSDPLADWNDRTFAVTARNGAIEVEPAGEAPTADVSVGALSRLAFGTTTADRAAVAGGLEADAATRSFLDALFPPREGFLRVFF